MKNISYLFLLLTGLLFYTSTFVYSTTASNVLYDDHLSFKGSSIPSGTRFQILEIPSDDAYYSDRDKIVGKTGKTTSAISLDADGFAGGSLTMDDGKSYYFYKVKLGKVSGSVSSNNLISGTIKVGTTLYIADISKEDAYFSNLKEYYGKRGTVVKNDMKMDEAGFYSGEFQFENGSKSYFYKVKFSSDPIGSMNQSPVINDWESSENDKKIKVGDKLIITAISKEDSYYSSRDKYIGKKGTASEGFVYDASVNAYSGSVKMDDGNTPYFYQVKVKGGDVSPVTVNNTSTFSGIAKGTRIVITDIDKADSFSSSKNDYIGKIGKVVEGLRNQGDGFYSGLVLFEDNSEAYFFKAKVTVLK